MKALRPLQHPRTPSLSAVGHRGEPFKTYDLPVACMRQCAFCPPYAKPSSLLLSAGCLSFRPCAADPALCMITLMSLSLAAFLRSSDDSSGSSSSSCSGSYSAMN